MMVANISKDLVFRATMEDSTARGAESARRTIKGVANDVAGDQKRIEAKNRSDLRKWGEQYNQEKANKAEQRNQSEIQSRIDLRKWEEDFAKQSGGERGPTVFETRRAARIAKRDALQMRKDTGSSPISDDELRGEQITRMYAESQRRRRAGGGGAGGHDGGGHFGRISSDASTTGLNTLNRGLLGGISETLGTGLQLGVLAVAGKALSDLTSKAAELSAEFRKGDADAMEIGIKIAETVPIIGSVVSAGRDIHEIFTGSNAELERTKEFTQQIEEANKRDLATSLRILENKKEQAAETSKQARDIAGVHLRGNDSTVHAAESAAASEQEQAGIDIQKIKDAALKDQDVKQAQDAFNKFNSEHGQRIADLQKIDPRDHATFGNRLKERDDLTGQRDILKQKQKRAEDQRDSTLQRDVAHRQETARGNATKSAEEIQEIHYKNSERIYGDSLGAMNRDKQLGEQTAAAALRTAGKIVEAKHKEIDSKADAEVRQTNLDAEGKKNATTDAHEREMIEDQATSHIAALNEQRKADLAQADKEAAVERKRIAYDSAQSGADAEAEAGANRLREAGKGYEAERALRTRELEKQKADIDQQATEAITQNGNNAKEIRAKAESDKKKLDSQFKEKNRQAEEQRISGEFGTAKELIGGHIEGLKAEAKAGNIAAASEAKRLEIAEQFAEKRERLNKMIRDPNVGKAEKDLAKGQLEGLDAQEERAKYMANFTGGATMPTLMVASRISGAALKANEEASPFIAMSRYMKEQGKTLTDISDATALMARVFQQNPQIAALFNFKPGR